MFMDNGMHRIKTGIYKLHLGDKFYIGRAKNIRTRAKQHMKDLEAMIYYKKEKGGQIGMFNHLMENPLIDRIRIEILEECAESELHLKEQHWIDEHLSDPCLLNIALKASRSQKDVLMSEFKPGLYCVHISITTVEKYIDYKKMVKEFRGLDKGILSDDLAEIAYIGTTETKPDHTA